jgi:NAD+ diphosphatase
MVASTGLGTLALSRSALDRNAECRNDEEWLARRWSDPVTRVVYVQPGRCWVAEADAAAPTLASVSARDALRGERYLLGTDADGVTFFAVRTDDPDAASTQLPLATVVGLREVGLRLTDRDAGLMVHAIALANWHASHGHCPRCGSPTQVSAAGAERRCPEDDSAHFPRTDPAVIMTVVDAADRVLLGRQEQWPPGRFSTLAGFVEPGEDVERAVVREVFEEARLVVQNVRYLGSQPWPFPASLMLGFTATAPTPQDALADGVELAEVRWFDRQNLLAELSAGTLTLSPPLSIARRLIEHWYGSELPDSATPWA